MRKLKRERDEGKVAEARDRDNKKKERETKQKIYLGRIDDKVMRVERPMIVGGDCKSVGIAVAADGAVPQHQSSNFHRNQQ